MSEARNTNSSVKQLKLVKITSKSSGGSRISPTGAPTYDFAKFSPKLHEIERIWTPKGGGGCVPRDPLDPPVKSMPFR